MRLRGWFVLALICWGLSAPVEAVQVFADRVRETSTTTGTGTLTLLGAVTNYRTFSTGIGSGNTTYYCAVHSTIAEWECGLGTMASGTTLARTTVLSSSTGAAVSFSAGTKDVFAGVLSQWYTYFPAGAPTDDTLLIGNGTLWQSKALPSCSGATDALAYTTATNAISCNTIATAGTGLSYWTRIAEAGLSGETAMGALGTGLIINTTTTGVPTIYAGQACTNQFVTATSASGALTCTTDTLASAQHANQGTTTTLLHGNASGNPSFGAVVSADLNITGTTCTNQFVSALSSAAAGTCTTSTLAGAQYANQGTTTTILHGNAAGNPSWAGIAVADHTATGTPSASTFLRGDNTWSTPAGSGTVTATGGALTANAVMLGAGTTDSKVLASLGTTTTLLHGNAAGAPTFGQVAIADLSATGTPSATTFLRGDNSWVAPGGSGTVTNIATTAPITGGAITTTGTIACATCVTSAAALTSGQLVAGGGSQASAVTNLTGDVTTSGGVATTIAANAVTTAKILDANVTLAKIVNVSAASKLLGRGSAAGAGVPQEITLGTNLSMSGQTLNATGGGSGPTITTFATDSPANASTTRAINSLTVRAASYFTTPGSITLNQLTLGISTVTAAGTMKACIYSADGATKLVDVTTGAASSNTPLSTVVSAVAVPAGAYYLVVGCATTCNLLVFAAPPEMGSLTSGLFGGGTPSGKAVWHGTVTHTSGTCNTTLGTVATESPTPLASPIARGDN